MAAKGGTKAKVVKREARKVERPKHLPANWQQQMIKFRESQGLTWEGFADLMGIHWFSIYRWTAIPHKGFPRKLAWERFKQIVSEAGVSKINGKKKGAKNG